MIQDVTKLGHQIFQNRICTHDEKMLWYHVHVAIFTTELQIHDYEVEVFPTNGA